jgi:hypothetical protein
MLPLSIVNSAAYLSAALDSIDEALQIRLRWACNRVATARS